MALRTDYGDQFLEDALPVLENLIFDEHEQYEDNVPEIFTVQDSNQWGEQTSTMAGIRPAEEKPEGSPTAFDDAIQGFDKTYIPVTYSIATSFSREIVEDNRLNLIEKTYRSLGLAMYQTKQIVSFNIFNDGFSDTGPDGVSLFNIAHPMIGGHTYNNRPTTDIELSVAGLREMEISMKRQPNHRNINIALTPVMVLAPPELMQTSKELLKSTERPDTANRAMNTFYDHNYGLVISPFLTSTTAWFALANKTQHELRFIDRVAPEVYSWEDEKTKDVNTAIRCRFDVGYSDFIGAWGTTG